jgi:hypothetical protein
MDKGKIDSVFEDLKNKKMLKKDGSFYMGDSVAGTIEAIFLALFFLAVFGFGISCLWILDGWRKILGMMLFSPFPLLFLWGLWVLPARLYWYRDRLVTKNSFGANVHEYSYSDISEIKRYSKYDEKSKTYEKKIGISFRKRGMDSISIDDNPRACEFFRSCFGDIFSEQEDDVHDDEYDLRMKLFARVLKRNATECRPYVKERQCAVRYFTSLKTYRGRGDEERYFTNRLTYWLKQCKRDTKEKCVEDCRTLGREIMKSKSMVYEERLALLTYFFECTYVEDGLVDEWELELLSQIAFVLEIRSWDFVSLKHRFEGKKQEESKQKGEEDTRQQNRYQQVCSNRKQEAYSLLELKQGATLEEVKRAYRTLVKSCHPDTLPPTATIKEREEAIIRFRSVTEAYDFLCAELSKEPVRVAR